MTNAEKYKDTIIAQECKTGNWAINKDTNEVMPCEDCDRCLFDSTSCTGKVEWLNSEYKEPKEFTDEERKFIALLDKAEWVARDDDNMLWIFSKKPHKEVSGRWENYSEHICISSITSLPFAAIKSTDTEPTSRAEILREND